jgi:hypothetical protein
MTKLRIDPTGTYSVATPQRKSSDYVIGVHPDSNRFYFGTSPDDPYSAGGFICEADCPSSKAELVDFPVNAFVGADNKRENPKMLEP